MSDEGPLELDEAAKGRLRAEEIFREETRKQLRENPSCWDRIVSVANKPFTLWALTITLGVILSGAVEGCLAKRQAERADAATKKRLGQELMSRYVSHLSWAMVESGKLEARAQRIGAVLERLKTEGANEEESGYWAAQVSDLHLIKGSDTHLTVSDLLDRDILDTLLARAEDRAADAKSEGHAKAHACLHGLEESIAFLRTLSALVSKRRLGVLHEEFAESSVIELLVQRDALESSRDPATREVFDLVTKWTSLTEAPRNGAGLLYAALQELDTTPTGEHESPPPDQDRMMAFAKQIGRSLHELHGYGKKLREIGAAVEDLLRAEGLLAAAAQPPVGN